MSRELVLCALHRLGAPSTAADVSDKASALAVSEGWPRSTWAALSPQSVSRLLQSAGCKKAGAVRDPTGNNRPMWQPPSCTFDIDYPLPARPEEQSRHPLTGRTPEQMYALFDALDTALTTATRQREELRDLVTRHDRELAGLAQRCKHQLLAAGFAQGGDA